MATISRQSLTELCLSAALQAGASPTDAQALATATVEAELVGNSAVGVSHLMDYLAAYRGGRISITAQPVVNRRAAAVLDVDADAGLAQTAFLAALDAQRDAAQASGIAALWIKNSFTCGELGYYPRQLALHGLIGLAMANSNSLMSLGGSPSSVLGTNPLAYALPRPGKYPVVIDQASSATAFVNIKRAAAQGSPIPAGWALGPTGEPTEDAATAVLGTLLPFGGHRGGNIALLVEVLATLSGGSFSVDAAPFDQGSQSPGIGVFVLAIDPAVFPGSAARLIAHLESVRQTQQVRLPALDLLQLPDTATIPDGLLAQLKNH